MTAEEAVKRLTAKVECMERENSGTDLDCDECELCYAQGTLSEQIEALKVALSALQEQEAKAQLSAEGTTNLQQTCNNLATDTISRQALCEYALSQKDKSVTPNDIMRFPSAQPTLYGYNVEHLIMIAEVLRKENMPPERVAEALTDIGRIVAIVRDEFEKSFRKAVEQCMT